MRSNILKETFLNNKTNFTFARHKSTEIIHEHTYKKHNDNEQVSILSDARFKLPVKIISKR